MIVFAIGDVVGEGGCELLRSRLSAFRRYKGIDICAANGENSAPGNGITPDSAQHLMTSGVDIITTGNHVFRRREIFEYLDDKEDIIRPANFCAENPGSGFTVIDLGRSSAAFINLVGNAFMDNAENAFFCVDRVLAKTQNVKIRLVDFHAEATGEKRAMGFYLDGRVSAVYGTHTHVQTADEQILPNGTGYITDLGMTGPVQSVLGVTPELVISKLKTGMPVHFANPDVPCRIDGCIFDIDDKTGICKSVERVQLS